MYKTIYKYKLDSDGNIYVPKGAKLLKTLIIQNGTSVGTYLWFEVDLRVDNETLKFDIFGTGWDMAKTMGVHIDTHIVGDFVWHLYQL